MELSDSDSDHSGITIILLVQCELMRAKNRLACVQGRERVAVHRLKSDKMYFPTATCLKKDDPEYRLSKMQSTS